MGIYKYIAKLWKQPKNNLHNVWKQRLIAWRKEPVTLRIEKPTRLDKARALGYKAKQGYIIVRQRVNRGGHMKEKHRSGRRPKRFGQKLNLTLNYQTIAESRANLKYPNCEVLNSYYVAKDGKHYWYEIILVDKFHPAIAADKRINWIVAKKHTGRVFRGKTSAGRKGRGLRNKGIGAEKIRPSLRANKRLGN